MAHGAEGGGIRKENIKNHVKYGSIGFKGYFLVFILARQNCISSSAFLVYPIPFLQYQIFQDFLRYGSDALICIKKVSVQTFQPTYEINS
jgi:hypothetical protein